MVVGEIPEAADLLVVGGGPGGYVAAIRAAQLGRSVLLVERGGDAGLGGVCLNVGCIPSKALIGVADAAHQLTALAPTGLTGTASLDLGQWQAWRRDMVGGLTAGIRRLLRSAGVTVQAGELRFTRPNQVVVETPQGTAQFYEFTDALIATGSRPSVLPGLVRDGERVLDSTDLLALTTLPQSIAVVGAGYIGIELGTALAKLGCRVTFVEAAERVLPSLDATLSGPVVRGLASLGITVLTGATVEAFDGSALRLRTAAGSRQVPADIVLVATGRTPNTDELGLDRLGIRPGPDGLLPVAADRRFGRHLAAVGDVTAGPALAHKASAEALVAVAALSGQRVAFQPQAIPVVVFSDPEIATAGLTAAQAAAAGADPQVVEFPLSASGRAAAMGAARHGRLQLVADRNSRAVLGVHIVGPHAGELIGEGVLAIEMGATVEDLAGSIHPHPTLSEQYGEAAQLALGLPIHLPPIRSSRAAPGR